MKYTLYFYEIYFVSHHLVMQNEGISSLDYTHLFYKQIIKINPYFSHFIAKDQTLFHENGLKLSSE